MYDAFETRKNKQKRTLLIIDLAHRFRLTRCRSRQNTRVVGRRTDAATVVVVVVVGVVAVGRVAVCARGTSG